MEILGVNKFKGDTGRLYGTCSILLKEEKLQLDNCSIYVNQEDHSVYLRLTTSPSDAKLQLIRPVTQEKDVDLQSRFKVAMENFRNKKCYTGTYAVV
jgi:hypothetical protein